jgi:hypothetical protein
LQRKRRKTKGEENKRDMTQSNEIGMSEGRKGGTEIKSQD